MKSHTLAGLAGLAALGAHAQLTPSPFQPSSDPLIVTATRALAPAPTLRDAIVITRDQLEAAGALSLGELLQRDAGIELRSTGGAGQPQTLFLRGAGGAQTLILVDGLRVGSASVGTTAIEHIPLEMIERIEIVKGPLSSLYGPDAIGGVIQVFTRGKSVPYFFGEGALGTDRDARVSTGLSTADDSSNLSMSMGARSVDAPSATNERAGFLFNPDRDPYRNAFANLHASHRLWQGETLAFDAFGTQSRTDFDNGASSTGDRTDQSIYGARFTSSSNFTAWWNSRLSAGGGVDRLVTHGGLPSRFETRQGQYSWVNEFKVADGTALLGIENLHQHLYTDESVVFTRDSRDTTAVFGGLNERFEDQYLEASIRRDHDEQFGSRNTGTASYGVDWPGLGRLAFTYGQGFRAPTFFDLYGPTFEGFYTPNPNLRPEHSKSRELSLKSDAASPWRWSVTAFDNRVEDLITYVPEEATVKNVARARTRGIEASLEGTWYGARWRASLVAQQPKDEDTGARLQGRAERFGTVSVERDFGAWRAGLTVTASGERFDSTTEDPGTRLPAYAVVDARVRYAIDKRWSVALAATNLADKRYESAIGYDAPRRAFLLSVRFESY
jgi:vitamin B12 transporter